MKEEKKCIVSSQFSHSVSHWLKLHYWEALPLYFHVTSSGPFSYHFRRQISCSMMCLFIQIKKKKKWKITASQGMWWPLCYMGTPKGSISQAFRGEWRWAPHGGNFSVQWSCLGNWSRARSSGDTKEFQKMHTIWAWYKLLLLLLSRFSRVQLCATP